MTWEFVRLRGEHVEVVTRNGQVQVFRRGEPLADPAPGEDQQKAEGIASV
jgi:hypothetical protein